MGAWAQRRRRASGGFNAVRGTEILLQQISGTSIGGIDCLNTRKWVVWRFLPTADGTLDNALIRLHTILPAGWGVRLELYADAAGAPGTFLDASNVVGSLDLPVSFHNATFDGFTYRVASGTTYWMACHATMSGGGEILTLDAVSDTGGAIYTSNDGSTWTLAISNDGCVSQFFGFP